MTIVERLMSHVKTYPEGKPMFRSYPPEALVVEAAEEIRRLRKALLEMQGAAALVLTIAPETGQVADLFASIHRHCASALSSGKSPVNEERQALDPRP